MNRLPGECSRPNPNFEESRGSASAGKTPERRSVGVSQSELIRGASESAGLATAARPKGSPTNFVILNLEDRKRKEKGMPDCLHDHIKPFVLNTKGERLRNNWQSPLGGVQPAIRTSTASACLVRV